MAAQDRRLPAARLRADLSSCDAAPGFMAFCSLVNSRIAAGDSLSAYRMLCSIGAEPGVAHAILEGWPTRSSRRLGPDVIRRCDPLLGSITLVQEAALLLSHHAPRFRQQDWPASIAVATRAAAGEEGKIPKRSSK